MNEQLLHVMKSDEQQNDSNSDPKRKTYNDDGDSVLTVTTEKMMTI
jgi:hypothetical protein